MNKVEVIEKAFNTAVEEDPIEYLAANLPEEK